MIASMIARMLLLVLALFIGANCADAGVIVSRDVIASEPSDAALLSLLAELCVASDSEVPQEGYFDAAPNDLAGIALASTQLAGHACLGMGGGRLDPPRIGWRLSLANAVLSPSPLLDGLLKPS